MEPTFSKKLDAAIIAFLEYVFKSRIFLPCFVVVVFLLQLSAKGLGYFIPFLQKIVFGDENILFFSLNLSIIYNKALQGIMNLVGLLFLYYILFSYFYSMEANKKKKIKSKFLLSIILFFLLSVGAIFLNYVTFSDKEIRYNKLTGLFEQKYTYDAISSVTITASIKDSIWQGYSEYFAPHMYLKVNDNEIDVWQNGLQKSREDIIKLIELIKMNTNINIKIDDNFSKDMLLLLEEREDKNDILEIFEYAKKVRRKK